MEKYTDDHLDRFKKYLKKTGLKFTPERKMVLECIFALHRHFDVDELYDRLRKENKNVSRASIYRTLPLLVKCKLIKEALRRRATISYEHIFGHQHHDHIVCLKCRKVIEFGNEKIEKLQDTICKKYSFKPVEHYLNVLGYCKKCSESIKKEVIKQ